MINPNQIAEEKLNGQLIAGRYLIKERIGKGAMGSVYRAEQSGLQRSVALKILKKDADFSDDTVRRFQREAKAASILTHPNTVRVFDFGATPQGLLFLAMEILNGEPVTNYLQRHGVLPVSDAINYTIQMLHSLAEAHEKGIIHRDIKPDNIFLAKVYSGKKPIVKLLDFGIAKAIEGDRAIDQFETQDGTVFGTPRYMSPEQAQGKQLDLRSDLYTVGITLFEFLTGHTPFVDRDAVVVMAKHIREPAPLVRKVSPDRPIPPSLEKAVKKSLQKNPILRFQNAEEFADALKHCIPDVELLERYSDASRFKKLLANLRVMPLNIQLKVGTMVAALFVFVGLLMFGLNFRETDRMDNGSSDNGNQTYSPEVQPIDEETVDIDPVYKSSILLESKPTGAHVWDQGKIIGTTPLIVSLEKTENRTIRLSKKGYIDFTTTISADRESYSIELSVMHRKRTARRKGQRRSKSKHRLKPQISQKKNLAPKPAKTESPYEKFD